MSINWRGAGLGDRVGADAARERGVRALPRGRLLPDAGHGGGVPAEHDGAGGQRAGGAVLVPRGLRGRGALLSHSLPQGMFLHFETRRSSVGECARPGVVPPLGVDSVPKWSRPWGWTLFPSAAPETLFQSHLPDRCVTVRPPYALHTLLVNLGPQSASLVSCFLLLDERERRMCLISFAVTLPHSFFLALHCVFFE